MWAATWLARSCRSTGYDLERRAVEPTPCRYQAVARSSSSIAPRWMNIAISACGEPPLQLLGRREHAALAERRPQEVEVQSPFHSSSRTCFAKAA